MSDVHKMAEWISWLIEAQWCIYSSVAYAFISSDDGLSRYRRQAIIWTSDGILSIGPFGTNFSEIFNQNSYFFFQENAFENVVGKMVVILSWPQCVKCSLYWNAYCSMSFTWWHHQTETFSRYWPFVWGIPQSLANSPHKGQWCGALMFSLICTWTKAWVNSREANDLRRHRAHYDVIVMSVCNRCGHYKSLTVP